MKALQNIQSEAKQIVEQLADRQITDMKEKFKQFQEWSDIEGNPVIIKSYNGDQVNKYDSAHKYIYMTQYKNWNYELKQYEFPTHYPTEHSLQREMDYDKGLSFMVYELRLQVRQNWEANYREDFIAQNMAKLNRALAKHLTDEMTAENIRINIGGDGAEVTANVDNKLFRTFGTLCGGYIQCLHYRYRSSLK
jgi:hypothetical protein